MSALASDIRIVRSRQFRNGVEAIAKNLPFDAFHGVGKYQFHYEWGRQFAICHPEVSYNDVGPMASDVHALADKLRARFDDRSLPSGKNSNNPASYVSNLEQST